MDSLPNPSLDPDDWVAFRQQSHRMMDDMLDYIENLRERPVWQAIPDDIRARYSEPLPAEAISLAQAHQRFMQEVLPYSAGNAHPGFMGWVQGGGTPVGMLAEMLAAGLNANLGGRNQMPVEVERQIVRWMRELFEFPDSASGVFVTGTSMANLMAVLVAKNTMLGSQVRQDGICSDGLRLVAYTSDEAHGCVAQAMDLSGFGRAALRRIPTDAQHRMDLDVLQQRIAADKQAGLRPFFIAGTAGTVDVGAIDPLPQLAAIAKAEGMWFHIDGAFGALGMLSPQVKPKLAGIELADSIAFDFHKWGQVPYDAGFLLVRDGSRHMDAFAAPVAYLRRETRGIAGGSPWPCDFGPDLSRGFRALKTWFTLQVYGSRQLGEIISHTCDLARQLEAEVGRHAELEMLAPVHLNVVCFRYIAQDADRVNQEIVMRLHEAGLAAPSTTIVRGKLAIRAAIVNHRTRSDDVLGLIQGVLKIGAEICQS